MKCQWSQDLNDIKTNLIQAEPMEEISSSCAAELELNKEPEPKIDDTEVYRSRNAM